MAVPLTLFPVAKPKGLKFSETIGRSNLGRSTLVVSGKTVSRKTKRSDNHETPQYLFDLCDGIWRFTIDVAATNQSAKCKVWFTPRQNAFVRRWYGRIWLNPPYSDLLRWMWKCNEEASHGTLIVALVPTWHGTQWFRDNCVGAEIVLMSRRLQFKGSKSKAIFDSCLVIWNATKAEIAQLRAKRLSVSLLDVEA
jgi:phage N-6-adenine-methyltransferase